MDLFSLGSVIMIIVTCSCLSFIFEVDFSETYLVTSAKNSVSEPPNWKIFWGRIPPDPPTRLLPSALAFYSPPPPPVKKRPSYGPKYILLYRWVHSLVPGGRRSSEGQSLCALVNLWWCSNVLCDCVGHTKYILTTLSLRPLSVRDGTSI